MAVTLFRPSKSRASAMLLLLIVGNYEISVIKNRPNDPEAEPEGRALAPPFRLGISLVSFRIFRKVIKNGGPKYSGLLATFKIVCSCGKK